MGSSAGTITGPPKLADGAADTKIAALSSAIAQTRDEIGGTIEQIHGRLNPAILKQEVLKQFMEAKDSIKSELKADLALAKESFHAGINETKESLKSEITETKQQGVVLTVTRLRVASWLAPVAV